MKLFCLGIVVRKDRAGPASAAKEPAIAARKHTAAMHWSDAHIPWPVETHKPSGAATVRRASIGAADRIADDPARPGIELAAR